MKYVQRERAAVRAHKMNCILAFFLVVASDSNLSTNISAAKVSINLEYILTFAAI